MVRVMFVKLEILFFKVYLFIGICLFMGDGLLGMYGVFYGIKLEMGFGVGRFRGFWLVSLVSMRWYV